ncbi:MAG: hypothetical protein EHM19_00635 [Candidatus Latescibacterota bacterium]|nr:MAG: hypothetical protein EHM19_00635 [Candidatus Latescibacterota bacterium]
MSRFALIGLESAPPRFLFDLWRDDLPNIGSVMKEGMHGVLGGTIPSSAIPAWTSMAACQDPGQLGLYGPTVRAARDHAQPVEATSEHVRAKTIWNYLSNQKLNSLVFAYPETWPPKPLKGVLVAGAETPAKDAQWTYPREASREVEAAADGDYMFDATGYGGPENERLLEQVYEMTRRRFAAFRQFARKKEFDFMSLVEIGPDRVQRAFWRHLDPEHPRYEAGHRHGSAIHDYYVFLDEELGRLLNDLPTDTSVMIVSARGARRSNGAFRINEWLRKEKLLAFKEAPEESGPLAFDKVDWGKTKAWAEGGSTARVYMNVKGREPKGGVPEADLESFRGELEARLSAIADESGSPLAPEVSRPEKIYRAANGVAPDFLVRFAGRSLRVSGDVGGGAFFLGAGEGDAPDADSDPEGVVIWDHPAKLRPKRKERYSVYDIAPTILSFFNLELPAHWIGEPLF